MKAHLSSACQSAGLSSCPTRDSWFWTAAYVLTAASQPGLSSFFPFSPFIPLALWTAYHISTHVHWLNSGSSWFFFPSSVLLGFVRVPFSSRTAWRYECMQKGTEYNYRYEIMQKPDLSYLMKRTKNRSVTNVCIEAKVCLILQIVCVCVLNHYKCLCSLNYLKIIRPPQYMTSCWMPELNFWVNEVTKNW